MPMYEFDCAECGTTFEELVASERAVDAVACPRCGAARPKKRMSTFAGRVGQPAARESACASGGCCFNGACGLN
jgi:putative FmdB family regulatory protein